MTTEDVAPISCFDVSFTFVHINQRWEGRDAETEPGSVAPDTPEKDLALLTTHLYHYCQRGDSKEVSL